MTAETTTIFAATGRRKTATARVRITAGTGKFTANDREFEVYFAHENFRKAAFAPLLTVEMKDQIDIVANVRGGGTAGQAGAVAHGVARALEKMDGELRVTLKKDGHLKRDPRQKERKKAGQPGARKRFQFSKR